MVASSGKPSMVLRYPRRVRTSAGAVIPGGVFVAILGLLDCAAALGAHDASARQARPSKRPGFMREFVITAFLS